MKVLMVLGLILVALVLMVVIGPFLVPVPPLEGLKPARQLADPDSRFVEVNGIEIHYKMKGQVQDGRPALILLHGFGASLFSWREVIEPLAEVGTVIAYDRPAFGLSGRPLAGEWSGQNPYSREAQVDLLIGLMDQLGIQKVILIGNSAGGTLAVMAALEYPERVQALVLVDAAIYESGGSPSALRWLYQTPQMDRLGLLLARSIGGERGQRLVSLAWHDASKITPQILEGYRKPLQVVNWDRAFWEFVKANPAIDLAPRLGELRLPVLVVTGDDDRIVPTELSLRLAQEIAGAELVVFESCGHLPQEECPQPFLEAVTEFITKVHLAGGK